MAKPSDIFKGAIKGLRSAAELGSHLHTASDIIGTLAGKEPSADAPATVKGLHGIFGHADERTFQANLQQLNPADQEALLGFFQWVFNGSTWAEKTAAWWGANELRTFIAKMGSSPGTEIGKKTSRRTWKSGKDDNINHEVVTRTSVCSKSSNNALAFMRWMAEVIRSESDRTKGYEKLRAELEQRGVPFGKTAMRVVHGADSSLRAVGAAIDDGVQNTAAAVETAAHNRRLRDERAGFLTRVLTRIGTWGFN